MGGRERGKARAVRREAGRVPARGERGRVQGDGTEVADVGTASWYISEVEAFGLRD